VELTPEFNRTPEATVKRQIEVSVDVFAGIWAARLPHQRDEDAVLFRLLKLKRRLSETPSAATVEDMGDPELPLPDGSRPRSVRWTDVLTWTLEQLGGKAALADIYRVSRQGRLALGYAVTAKHDASARECLESHCSQSLKYREKADLFCMPQGKGAGIWALVSHHGK
jgi:hypothetical protein